METISFALQLLFFILVADFLTGFFHFLADQYGHEHIPIIGKHVVRNNSRHHDFPRQILEKNYFQLTYQSWTIGILLVAGVYYSFGIFNWAFTMALVFGAQANLIHSWSHRTRQENGVIITFLQDKSIIQSRKHHGLHHHSPYDVHYCVMTDWLNPILDEIKIWEFLIGFFMVFGIKPVEKTGS